ncbi:cilia- and flagella-associated protein 300 isoform X1 [Ictalurus punctatus]|uniref:Cilia- and flagella-associated protein 300 n=1 Tax=Ictalurus punctatus TaxID=7998 RepID=A0A9F7RV70_ICTPU|nr:cilia- and flagella-associated protein 300 isoform X1 [Ictalurus punctatus]
MASLRRFHGNCLATTNMASETHAFAQTFSFNLLPNRKFTILEDTRILELLMKWSMLGRISIQAFNFDQVFQSYMKNDFVLDPCVKNNLLVLDSSGVWKPLGRDVTHVDVELVPCTKVSLNIFDPIFSSEIVHPSGHIAKCFHEVHLDFDELRMMLLEEESHNYHVVSPCDRQEFLFRLFKHIVLGGEICQYEDFVSPYIETAKTMYKDLVSVQKDSETKMISIVSTILKVSAYDDYGLCYPSGRDNEQTFAYLCIDPFKRHVYVLYHSFGIGKFSNNAVLCS